MGSCTRERLSSFGYAISDGIIGAPLFSLPSLHSLEPVSVVSLDFSSPSAAGFSSDELIVVPRVLASEQQTYYNVDLRSRAPKRFPQRHFFSSLFNQ